MQVDVTFHESQLPEAMSREWIASFRQRRINHKFHYAGWTEMQRWHRLFCTFSPIHTDAGTRKLYEQCFAWIASRIQGQDCQLVSLGCGTGEKDETLIRTMHERGAAVSYVPCDASVAMVLSAIERSARILPAKSCHAIVADVLKADDLHRLIDGFGSGRGQRIVAAYGIIPNFEAGDIFPRLASLLSNGDLLVMSANLLPGRNPDDEMRRILPQYDNGPTRDWLMGVLDSVGIGREDGVMEFQAETGKSAANVRRIVAQFRFVRACRITIVGEQIEFARGDQIQVFFSNRYDIPSLEAIVTKFGLSIVDRWINDSVEEGAFVLSRKE